MSWRLALLFFVLAILSRLPFQTENLWAHDSVLYDRAIDRFSPIDQQPQAPGYLYYVLLIRALDAITRDANRAMTVISLLAEAAAIALLYVFAARLYDERTGRISALFLFSAVTFWAYAGIAYPYTLLAALTIACAFAFWRAATRVDAAALLGASALYGVAIGFRSDLAIFLAPLWLIAAWGKRLATAVAAAAIVVALFAVWYVASALLGGGFAAFSEALREQGQFVDDRYSMFGERGLSAIGSNVYELARFLGRATYFLTPLLAAVALSASSRHIELSDRKRSLFVLAWALTPLVIYVPIHVGEYGYVFSMLPGLCVIAARGAIALARGSRLPQTLPWLVAAVVLANASIFLISDTPLSAADVIRRDRGTIEKLDYLETAHDLAGATIVTAYDALVVIHYSMEHTPGYGSHSVIGYDPANPAIEFTFGGADCAPGVGPLQGCAHSPVLAVWDDLVRVHGDGWQEVRMAHGSRLRVARNAAGAHVTIQGLDVSLSR
jgi:dolichyl-phosphate-mannose-protein mannosyltransferase